MCIRDSPKAAGCEVGAADPKATLPNSVGPSSAVLLGVLSDVSKFPNAPEVLPKAPPATSFAPVLLPNLVELLPNPMEPSKVPLVVESSD